MKIYTKFEDVPVGFYLCRMYRERDRGYSLHLSVKAHDGAWFDQPNVPCFSDQVSDSTSEAFWKWAKGNLPIFHNPIGDKPGR